MNLLDANDNPLGTSALTISREAISDETKVEAYSPPGEPWAGRPGASFSRWSPWVRQAAMVQELMQELHIGAARPPVPAVDAAPASRASCEVLLGSRPLVLLECPGQDEFNEQVRLVLGWAELRAERRDEILAQMATPYAFLASVAGLRSDQHRFTFELLACLMQVAAQVHMRIKAEFAAWRPSELSPQVQPMISVPGHGSFPSGHATEAFACITVLKGLLAYGRGADRSDYMTAVTTQLERLAARIATNRVVAGVHFPVDSVAGRLLGVQLGTYVLAAGGVAAQDAAAQAAATAQVAGLTVKGYRFGAEEFFTGGAKDLSLKIAPGDGYLPAVGGKPCPLSSRHALLFELTRRALEECANHA